VSLLKRKVKSALILLLLCALIILTLTGQTQRFVRNVGLKHLHHHNQQYLQTSLNQSLATFAVLSGIKVGLAILEGSELGVGFGLEVGDAVQSTYDYVDLAWRTVLSASAILMGTQFLLHASKLLEPWCLSVTLILAFIAKLLFLIFPGHRVLRPVKDLTVFALILTVSLYLLLPLSIWGGSRLSRAITAPALNEADSDLTRIRGELFPETKDGQNGLAGRLKEAKNTFDQITHMIVAKTKDLSLLVLKIIAGYLFDTLIFPLVLFVLFFYFTRIAARYIFEIQRQQSFHEDLEMLLNKYLHPKSHSNA